MEIVQSKCETSNVLEILDLSENCLKGDDVTVSFCDSLPMPSLCDVGRHCF